MNVKVDIFYPRLKQLIDKPDTLTLGGGTVGECLDEMIRRFPGSTRLLFNGRGELLRQVYVYVNAESTYKAALDTPLKVGDRLIFAALVVGG